jgi:hypothetical protein
MKSRHIISLVSSFLTCTGALLGALAFSGGSKSYPLAWELLTTLPLVVLQLLSAVTSWRLKAAPPITKQLVAALLISAISFFVCCAALVGLVVIGLALAAESSTVVFVLGALLFVLPLSSFLNSKACWHAIFASESSPNAA